MPTNPDAQSAPLQASTAAAAKVGTVHVLIVQLPVASKDPSAWHSPGLTHVNPLAAVTAQMVPTAIPTAPESQFAPDHAATPAPTVGTVHVGSQLPLAAKVPSAWHMPGLMQTKSGATVMSQTVATAMPVAPDAQLA